jgi:hexokinase
MCFHSSRTTSVLDNLGWLTSITRERSLVENYPNFEQTLRESLRAVVGQEVEGRVNLGMAKDGSGVGGELYSGSLC